MFARFILGLNLVFSFKHSKCKQKHDMNFVNITENGKLCILLVTWRLTLQFSLTLKLCPLEISYWSIINIKTLKEPLNTRNAWRVLSKYRHIKKTTKFTWRLCFVVRKMNMLCAYPSNTTTTCSICFHKYS